MADFKARWVCLAVVIFLLDHLIGAGSVGGTARQMALVVAEGSPTKLLADIGQITDCR
jgi:hypothetical protein